MFCEGQLLPISENETLFQLIGTTYGGDGRVDLRAAGPARPDSRSIRGTASSWRRRRCRGDHADGQQIPAHSHPLLASTRPANDRLRQRQRARANRRPSDFLKYAPTSGRHGAAVDPPAGGSQPHTNFQPYLCVDFIISLFGIFPSPTRRIGGIGEQITQEKTMADPFVAEIRIFPFNFAPKGWAWCDGQLLPLSQNTALFSLLGTTYGGDGK